MTTFGMTSLLVLAVACALLSASTDRWAHACTQSLSVNIGVSEAAQCAYVFSVAESEDGSCTSMREAMQQWLADQDPTLPAGPIAHYAFEEDLTDSTANGRDGWPSGAVGFGQGQCGLAASFDGSSKVVVNAFRNFAWGSRFSVSAWFRRTGARSNYQGVVNTGYHHHGSWEIRMGREFAGQMLGGGVLTPDSAAAWDYVNIQASYGDWHHVAMTYDGVELLFYLDNQLQSGTSDCCHGDIVSKDTPLTIGQAGVDAPAEYFVGLIDEVKIYDRVLSAADVERLYNSPCA